jgi:RND family efflux transporter MFP subunit
MKVLSSEKLRRLLIIPPVAVGVLVFWLLVQSGEGPLRSPLAEQARTVRVIKVPRVAVVPRALGYGTARPGKVWQAVAEVKGKIIHIHPQLKKGAILPAGAVLLRIDTAEYRLAIAQMEANIQNIRAQLDELEVKEKNYRASLNIEQSSLVLSEKELQRIQDLRQRQLVSQSELDQESRNVLSQRKNVQSLKNSLNLVPAERRAMQATLAVNRAKLADAKLDLDHTTITAPFDCRIAQVNVEKAQYVTAGQVLAETDGIAVAEINAQFSIDKIRSLLKPHDDPILLSDLDRLADLLGLSALVRMKSGDFVVEWDARFARVSETLDPQTRTVGMVVAVDGPYKKARPGIRPPVIKGMFFEVELRGRPREGCTVVPRSALHGNEVYVVASELRLEKRIVKVNFNQRNFVCLKEGLEQGETIIVSDPIPAIEGMLLNPVMDEKLEQDLLIEAKEGTGIK